MDEEGVCYEYWCDFVWWEYAGHVNDVVDHENDDVVKRGRGTDWRCPRVTVHRQGNHSLLYSKCTRHKYYRQKHTNASR